MSCACVDSRIGGNRVILIFHNSFENQNAFQLLGTSIFSIFFNDSSQHNELETDSGCVFFAKSHINMIYHSFLFLQS